MGGRFLDYMGQGEASARPLVADMATRIAPDALAVYLSQDTGIISFYDDSDPAWIDFDIAKLNHPKFQLLEDVDWTTPPTDNQLMRWDNVAGKFKPFTLPADATLTPEQVQDIVGAFIANGSGINVAYDDPGNSLVISCTVTQYTDAMANARADARIAVAILDALADVETAGTYAPTHNQVLSWDNVAGKWRPRSLAGSLAGLTDVDVSVAPTNNQVLTYDSATSKWKPKNSAGGSGSAPAAPTLRGSNSALATTTTITVNLPAGSAAGDIAFLQAGSGYSPNNPAVAGWIEFGRFPASGTSGILLGKTLTAGDISTGSVTVAFNSNYNCSVDLIVFVGSTVGKLVAFQSYYTSATGSVPLVFPQAEAGAYNFLIITNRSASVLSCTNSTILQRNNNSDASHLLAKLDSVPSPIFGLTETMTIAGGTTVVGALSLRGV